MVQMKESEVMSVLSSLKKLYIPHGSDESSLSPHSSSSQFALYIPHGSDESKHIKMEKEEEHTLYPTWFR